MNTHKYVPVHTHLCSSAICGYQMIIIILYHCHYNSPLLSCLSILSILSMHVSLSPYTTHFSPYKTEGGELAGFDWMAGGCQACGGFDSRQCISASLGTTFVQETCAGMLICTGWCVLVVCIGWYVLLECIVWCTHKLPTMIKPAICVHTYTHTHFMYTHTKKKKH